MGVRQMVDDELRVHGESMKRLRTMESESESFGKRISEIVFEMCGREIIFTATPRWAPNVPAKNLVSMESIELTLAFLCIL
jgi:hypothetical protein